MSKIKCALIGSGNIGTDLLIKIQETSDILEAALVIGIDADSEGLRIARERGVATTHEGIEGAVASDIWSEIAVCFDATSAGAHNLYTRWQINGRFDAGGYWPVLYPTR